MCAKLIERNPNIEDLNQIWVDITVCVVADQARKVPLLFETISLAGKRKGQANGLSSGLKEISLGT